MWGQIVGGAAGQILTQQGITGGSVPNVSELVDRSTLNIQPVGVNLGTILQPFEHSVPNGGLGIQLPTGYIESLIHQGPAAPVVRPVNAPVLDVPGGLDAWFGKDGNDVVILMLIGAGLLVLLFALKKGR